MKLTSKNARVVARALSDWCENGDLSARDSDRLLATIETMSFDWRRLARYSFWIAIACVVIALFAAVSDAGLLRFLMRLLTFSAFGRSMALAVLAGILYALSLMRRRSFPERIYSNEALCFLGVLATAGAVASLGQALSSRSDHYSILILLAALIYAAIGLGFPSIQVWVFALFSLASWIGFETGYVSGWGAYYLGLNYPARFLLVGIVLVGASHLFLIYWPARIQFWRPTFIVGLLLVFLSLWIMSIFGNYGDMRSWSHAGYGELVWWCMAFAAASGLAIWYGLKLDERISVGFGITFLFINLYTRFFEHFWAPLHKAIFFAVLGASFWFIGTRAEKIWMLGGLVRTSNSDDQTGGRRASDADGDGGASLYP